MRTHVLNNPTHAVLADANIMGFRARQRVAEQSECGMYVAAFVGGGVRQMLQLVEALSANLQTHRFDQGGETLVHVVRVVSPNGLAAAELEPSGTPWIAFAGAEKQIVAFSLRQDRTQRGDGFRPQRNDVIFAGLPAPVVDASFVKINDGAWKVGKFLRPVSAIQGKVNHRPQLNHRRHVSTTDALFQSVQDDSYLVRRVQLPSHLHRGPAGRLGNRGLSEIHGSAPALLDSVIAGGAKMAKGALGKVRRSILVQRSVKLTGVIRSIFGYGNMTHDVADSLGAVSVLKQRAGRQFSAERIGLPVAYPTRKNELDGNDLAATDPNRDGLHAREQGGGFLVIDLQGFLGLYLAANPPGLAGDAGHVAAWVDGQRKALRQGWWPCFIHSAFGACVWRGGHDAGFLGEKSKNSSGTRGYPRGRGFLIYTCLRNALTIANSTNCGDQRSSQSDRQKSSKSFNNPRNRTVGVWRCLALVLPSSGRGR